MGIATSAGNTAHSYGSVAKTFHWLTALLVLTAIPLGVVANNWAYDSSQALATKAALFSLHKTVGVTVFFVALLRIFWALAQPKPAPMHPERRLESRAADTVHWLLYISLVIVPLSGWMHHAATSGFAPIWWPFGQTLPLVPQGDAVAQFFAAWHWVFTKVLVAAVLLHIAGAAKHVLIDRDGTLARMLPGGGRDGTLTPAPQDRAPAVIAAGIYAAAVALGTGLGLSDSADDVMPASQITAERSGWTVTDGTLAISVSQLGSPVEGQFRDWSAAIEFDPDAPADEMGSVRVEIAVPSLALGSVSDQALGPEFFAAEAHPTAVFDATITATPDAERGYRAEGTLTLKGASVPVALPFDLTLEGNNATMQGHTTLDRRDFAIGTQSYDDEKTVGFGVDVVIDLTASRSE